MARSILRRLTFGLTLRLACGGVGVPVHADTVNLFGLHSPPLAA